MHVLVPVDRSDASTRALRFGAELADRFDADFSVVHVTEERTEKTERLLSRTRTVLEEVGTGCEPEVVLAEKISESGGARRVGDLLLDLAEERGYDHVVMGRHGGGRLERFVLGSASEVVLEEGDVPVTLIP